MGDVFEDVVSDADFSDDEEAALSDEDIAQVLGLMDDTSGATRPSVPESMRVQNSIQLEKAVSPPATSVVPMTASPAVGVSDFDRFLADFTRQQERERQTEEKKEQPGPLPGVVAGESEDSRQDGQATAPLNWGVFTPDKMPTRCAFDPVARASISPKKLKVVVPNVAYLLTKTKPRRSELHDKDLTFRPTINAAYFRRRGVARLRGKSTIRFTTRMEHDIRERTERQQRREAAKRQQEECDVRRLHERRRSLVAKGSQAILERNGLWEESMEDRLERLRKPTGRSPQKPVRRSSATAKARKQEKLRENEAAKARACESLYRRGLDKLQRVRTETLVTPRSSPNRRLSHRSDSIVRERVDREVQMICAGEESQKQAGCSASPQRRLPSSVSFVEFSCVLLYFGFVPAPDTPWEGDARRVTLLWHAWITYAERDGETREVPMSVLKYVLESVMIHHHHTPRRGAQHDPNARLLEIFRLNYIARKRSPSADGLNDCKPKPKLLSHGHKVSYSIHGKAVRPHEDAVDVLEMRHTLAQERVEAMRRAKEQDGLAECTFKPQITSGAGAESISSFKFRETDETSTPSELEPFERLYSDAFVRQNNNTTQYLRARREEEEQHKKEMRVSPTYLNGRTIEERLERLQESLSNNALPVHFYEKIAEMRHAYAAKLEDAREKASRLEPAHTFTRTRDGHTIVVPFKFATQQRTKEDRRNRRVATTGSRPSVASALRDLRLHYDPQAPSADAADCRLETQDQDDAADLCIDVHVSPFETYRLILNRGDDVYKATQLFAETYRLDRAQHDQLLCHARAKLEQLVDL